MVTGNGWKADENACSDARMLLMYVVAPVTLAIFIWSFGLRCHTERDTVALQWSVERSLHTWLFES